MSTRTKIRFTGLTVLPVGAVDWVVNWEARSGPMLERFEINLEKAPNNINSSSGVLLVLYRPDNSYLKEIDLGEIGDIRLPNINEYLNSIVHMSKMRVRIYQKSEGNNPKLLSSTKKPIRLKNTKSGDSIIATRAVDLGDGRIWKLDIDLDDDYPIIEINKKDAVLNAESFLEDPLNNSLILPSVVEEILTRYMMSSDWDSNSFKVHWIKEWAGQYGDIPDIDYEDPDHVREITSWAKEVAEKFSQRVKLFQEYKAAAAQEGL